MLPRIAPLALLACALAAAQSPLQPIDSVTVKSADYTPGATVRIEGTAGELNIETWDEPRVEATLTRTEYASARDRDAVKKRLDAIGLTVAKSGAAIDIKMTAPRRRFLARWLRGKTDATLTCRVMVPRDANLVVRHEDGSVTAYATGGNIDASARAGDITLQLAGPEQYAIDARVKLGGVYTDYAGTERARKHVGQTFVSQAPAGGAHKILLRVGTGGIEIVKAFTQPQTSGN